MYTIKPFAAKVYLIHESGKRWEYSNIISASMKIVDAFGIYNLKGSVGLEHSYITFYPDSWWNGTAHTYPYIVRTEAGDKVTSDDIIQIYNENRPIKTYSYWWRHTFFNDHSKFRDGPVPGTGGYGRGRSYYRHPQTSNERRQTGGFLHEEECRDYKIKVRGKRRPPHLPSVYDDRTASDQRQRSWKQSRKTQWKNNK